MSLGQKLAMLKIRSISVTFLSLHNLEAAPEKAMQLRRLIKSSNESLGPYLFGKFKFWNFQGPRAEIPGGYSTSKSPGLIGLKRLFRNEFFVESNNATLQHFLDLQCHAPFLSLLQGYLIYHKVCFQKISLNYGQYKLLSTYPGNSTTLLFQ